MNVFSTHLDNSRSDIREAQVRELMIFLSRFREPRIVAGDLNATPEAPEIRLLEDRLFDAWGEAVEEQRAVAYPDNPAGPDTRTRAKRIDYVLHSPDLFERGAGRNPRPTRLVSRSGRRAGGHA